MDTLITNIGHLFSAHIQVSSEPRTDVASTAPQEILIQDGRIRSVLPVGSHDGADLVIDAEGGAVMPGFVDAHAHLCEHGEMPELGVLEACLRHRLAQGITTTEIKASGAGDPERGVDELRLLHELRDRTPVRLVSTFTAEIVDCEGRATGERVARMIGETIPRLRRAKLAHFFEARVPDCRSAQHEIRSVLRAARGAGFRLKLHLAEQDQAEAIRLAVGVEACSVDHARMLSSGELKSLRRIGTTPVLLPLADDGCSHHLEYPDGEQEQHGIAIGSDYDFSRGGIESPWVLVSMAVCAGWSFDAAMAAVTSHAASALDLDADVGTVEVGKMADLLVLEGPEPREATWRAGRNPVRMVLINGRVVSECR